MSNDKRRIPGALSDEQPAESRPNDHIFTGITKGDQPGESRLHCSCGWTSASAPGWLLDMDIHIAEVNGISYQEQKKRTASAMRKLSN